MNYQAGRNSYEVLRKRVPGDLPNLGKPRLPRVLRDWYDNGEHAMVNNRYSAEREDAVLPELFERIAKDRLLLYREYSGF